MANDQSKGIILGKYDSKATKCLPLGVKRGELKIEEDSGVSWGMPCFLKRCAWMGRQDFLRSGFG